MKWSFIVLLALVFSSFTEWGNDLDKAKTQARQEHKLILLNFSGSDWCGPCIRMQKEIFSTEQFQQYANEHLVLLNADFPRNKKNQLKKELQESNDHLAELYNSKGIFPYTVLLNAEGKFIKSWEGYPSKGIDNFISQLTEVGDGQ
ncbi:thioredoxin family protein [Flavihumibacter fluvii]|uniref:thioredoxin family protein n=1 Tax=Flavihumibacter fluvii TaxID=2838157 RepID=UPI001BDF4565|nr:thioredoxin family protein [Flavihumibacter fluvii]ULQ51621.1 thioredoxin family protein [Flavihumibacter fluvii]